MFPATLAAHPPPGVPASAFDPPPQPGVLPCAAFGPVEDEHHIVVLGGQGPEIMCALLRAGASNVTHLRAQERPEPESASMVIVPRVPSPDWLATALPSIRRALTAQGRLVLLAGPQPNLIIQIRRMLTLHGLSAIRAHNTSEGQVVWAARPTRSSGRPMLPFACPNLPSA